MPAKRFIQRSWDDIPSTADLRAHWREMDADTPFDGFVFSLELSGDNGESYSSIDSFWDSRPWKWEWFLPALDDLASCRFEHLRTNFACLSVRPATLDWFDDGGWATLAAKARLFGRFVRESEVTGLCIDFELSPTSGYFRYDPAGGRSFVQAGAEVRKRGAQFMRALAQECPSTEFLSLNFNSATLAAGSAQDPAAVLATHPYYGLLPAFVDGIIDATPPEMTLIDGCKVVSYLYDGPEDHLRGYNAMRQLDGPAVRLVSPENRDKYRQQAQAAFHTYLNTYLNPEGDPWYIGGHGRSRLSRLYHNLTLQRQFSDRYVFVYGEQYRWWPFQRADKFAAEAVPRWEQIMPGITRAIRWARNPEDAGRRDLAEARRLGTLANLMLNPGFEGGADPATGLPQGYSVWQPGNGQGEFTVDRHTGNASGASARFRGSSGGGLLQLHRVQPGEWYAVEAECRGSGSSVCELLVRWQTADGNWLAGREEAGPWRPGRLEERFQFTGSEGNWKTAFGVVCVPPEAQRLAVLLLADNRVDNADVCWFDNVGLYRLAPPAP